MLLEDVHVPGGADAGLQYGSTAVVQLIERKRGGLNRLSQGGN